MKTLALVFVFVVGVGLAVFITDSRRTHTETLTKTRVRHSVSTVMMPHPVTVYDRSTVAETTVTVTPSAEGSAPNWYKISDQQYIVQYRIAGRQLTCLYVYDNLSCNWAAHNAGK